jgi:hypothetical protein
MAPSPFRLPISSSVWCAAVLVVCAAVALSGCRKPPESYSLPDAAYQQWAAPLGEALLGVNDVLEGIQDSTGGLGLEVGEAGVLDLVWSGDLGSIAADTSLYLPEWTGAQGFELDAMMAAAVDILPLGTPMEIDLTDTVAWTVALDWGAGGGAASSDVRIDEIVLAGGTLEISVLATTGELLIIDWGLPGLIAPGGTPWAWNYSSAAAPVGTPQTMQIDLAGYRILPEQSIEADGGIEHAMVLDGSVSLSNLPGWSSAAGQGLDANLQLTDLTFAVAWGDFGSSVFQLDEDSIKLALFDDRFNIEALEVERAELVLHAVNGFGVPLRFDSTHAYSEVIASGTQVALNYTGNWTVPAAAAPWGAPGESSAAINASNSALPQMLGAEPRHFILGTRAGLNPDGPPLASNLNFLTSDAVLELSADARLPLIARLHGLTFQDTIDLSLETDFPDEMDSLVLRIITTNGLPFSAGIQLLLLDSSDALLDSLAPEEIPLLVGALIDDQGLPTTSTVSVIDIPFDADRAALLSATRRAVVLVTAHSTLSAAGRHAAITEDSELKIELGVKIYTRVEL